MKNILFLALATTFASPLLAGSADPVPSMNSGIAMPASSGVGGYLSAFYQADTVLRIAGASEDGEYIGRW
ncbi:MAG TPA: hypothetical protein EYG79_00555 [Rhodobacteraceae bacterium]|nr:hypothetical protein [Paracoccaceae bacterium]